MAKNEGLKDDRGALLIHVAFALLALMAFASFTFDYGVLWVSRNQAQNAADAGALAGAVSLAFDSTDDTASGPAKQSAQTVALANVVWGETPSVDMTQGDVKVCPGDSGCGPTTCVTGSTCVRVDVYRNTARGNPLPMFFGSFVGLTTQDIRATATAQVSKGNATDCLKPWGVIDRWDEHYPLNPGTWSTTSTYDKYLDSGGGAGTLDPAIPVPDYYEAPTSSSPGTGFRPYNPDGSYSSDYGRQMELTLGDNNDFAYAAGWFAALALNDSRGGSDYKANIKGCVGVTYKIGDSLVVSTEPGEKVGPTRDAVGGPDISTQDDDSIYNKDPGAYWDSSLNGGRGGVAGSAYASSPRIVAVPVVSPEMMVEVNNNGRTDVYISNILGFFVEGYDKAKKVVVGRLVTMPGLMTVGGTTLDDESTFMKTISLVR